MTVEPRGEQSATVERPAELPLHEVDANVVEIHRAIDVLHDMNRKLTDFLETPTEQKAEK